uniref:Uncharacterized protein n=1 Tax=Romanomermis culicivorax TaxID=13658 RepID=A0A915IE06_ROMCU
MGYWPQPPIEPEWVHGLNIEPILKQLATRQFPGLGIVGFDVEKVKKVEDYCEGWIKAPDIEILVKTLKAKWLLGLIEPGKWSEVALQPLQGRGLTKLINDNFSQKALRAGWVRQVAAADNILEQAQQAVVVKQ